MNITKSFGIVGAIAAAFALALPQRAAAAHSWGDIRSIESVTVGGSADAPLTVGEKVQVKFRLQNYPVSGTAYVGDPSIENNPWQVKYLGSLSSQAVIDDALHPLQIGLWIGGRTVWASTHNDADHVQVVNSYYTEIIFEYTVTSGDIGLPVMFANENGTGPASVDYSAVGSNPKYCFRNTLYWGICDTDNNAHVTESANLFMGPNPPSPEPPNWYDVGYHLSGAESHDVSLLNAGIYVQTVEYDDKWDDSEKADHDPAVDVWRAVYEDSTDIVSSDLPSLVRKNAATNDNQAIYLWTDAAESLDGKQGVVMKSGVKTEMTVYDGNTPRLVTNLVYTLSFASGESSATFALRGVTAGVTNRVYMSSTKGYVYDDTKTLVTNFVTRLVASVVQPDPFVKVELNNATSLVKTVPYSDDVSTPVATLKVTLSKNPHQAFKMKLNATVGGKAYDENLKWFALSDNDTGTPWADKTALPEISFSLADLNSGTLSKSYNLYLRGGQKTDASVVFTPDDYPAFFVGSPRSATLTIKENDPVVAVPAEISTTGKVGVFFKFKLDVADGYNNYNNDPEAQNDGYTVWYKREGWDDDFRNTYDDDTELPKYKPSEDEDIAIKFPTDGNFTTRVYLVGPDGKKSNSVSFNVAVSPTSTLGYTIDGGVTHDECDEGEDEDKKVQISFDITEKYPSTLYVYLEPLDEATSNFVAGTCLTTSETPVGIQIKNGSFASGENAELWLLDGSTGGKVYKFRAILTTSPQSYTKGVVTKYASDDIIVKGKNVKPVLTKVRMGSASLRPAQEGETIGNTPAGLSQVFRLDVTDVVADYTNGFEVVWNFGDGTGDVPQDGDPRTCSTSHAFSSPGEKTVAVSWKDKDMKSMDTFTFKVTVDDSPRVVITRTDGEDRPFLETDIPGRGYYSFSSNFKVSLSVVPTEDIRVVLAVKSKVGGRVVPEISAAELTFPAGSNEAQPVSFLTLDGTDSTMTTASGFTLDATVTTGGTSPDLRPWSQYLAPASFPFAVENVQPEIAKDSTSGHIKISPSASATNTVSIYENVNLWLTVKDSYPDITDASSPLKVTVTVPDSNPIEFCISNAVSRYALTASGTAPTPFSFSTPGYKVVTVVVTDKEGVQSEPVEIQFMVNSCKKLFVVPHGPDKVSGYSDLSTTYNQLPLGIGAIKADGTWRTDYDHQKLYTYSEEVNSAMVTATGDKQTIGGLEYESFLYCFIRNIAGEGSGDDSGDSSGEYTTTRIMSINVGGVSSSSISKSINIASTPANADDDTATVKTYYDTIVEAVFSREYRPADNLGDVNQDGIPDTYAWYKYNAGYLYLVATGAGTTTETTSGDTTSTSTTSADGADATSLDGYNGDEDFFPAAWSCDNPLRPSKLGWGDGEAFTAFYEIRGLHPGLNADVSDLDLSEAETRALLADYAANNVIPADKTEAEVYDLASAWAKDSGWTCEARLDPTMADTDSDGFPDGWEYFFWYYAKVGVVDAATGDWQRLTGRRFSSDAATLGTGKFIPSSEIVLAFNPTKKRGEVVEDLRVRGVSNVNDFDNDGLLDLEELVLGTNPIDWDSDSDGMCDYYEVMNGLDPLDDDDGLRVGLDSKINPDRDFMAWYDYTNETYTVFGLADGTFWAAPSDAKAALEIAAPADSNECFRIEKTEGTEVTAVYFSDELPPTKDDGGKFVLDRDLSVSIGVKCGEEWFVGTETTTLLADTEVGKQFTEEDKVNVGKADGAYVRLDAADESKTWFAVSGKVKTFVRNNRVFVADDLSAYLAFDVGGTLCRGDAVTVYAGTELKAAPAAAGYVAYAKVGDFSFSRVNPGTEKTEDFKNVALKFFRYGNENGPFVPCAATVTNFGKWAALPASSVTSVSNNASPVLIHHQVFAQFGFDPRTAWARDDFGYVAARWHKVASDEGETEGETGLAVNTVPFSNLDEFLLLQYRLNVADLNASVATVVGMEWKEIIESMTLPNVPFTSEDSDSNSESNVVEAASEVHGADSDEDGIPDGWELYVNANPLDKLDASLQSGDYSDDDDLNFLEEFAGVDSCSWYSDCESIVTNNPGKTLGWWNKFFPTNPRDADTDGDGLYDHEEGAAWSATFYVGKNKYSGQSHTFIYGNDSDSEDTTVDDGVTKCFRGGGLNPCTVDTDQDLLPDAWEYEFAGVLFKDGAPVSGSFTDLDLKRLTVADGLIGAVKSEGYEIRGGMDGTFKGDHSYDFDRDGLMNWQEYMVQTIRCFRYDDFETPLMGISPDSGKFVQFLPFQSWDGEAFFQTCVNAGFSATGAYNFRALGYFALPPHEWDRLRLNTTGIAKCANYGDAETGENCGYRILLRPHALIGDDRTSTRKGGVYAGDIAMYACTDPRQWDSDHDGMDDYWELFHGLNPLLGTSEDTTAVGLKVENRNFSNPNMYYDRIAAIYSSDVVASLSGAASLSAWMNGWTGWPVGSQTKPAFDPIKYPWMMGTPDCDADGDGIRNIEEALQVDVTTPAPSHTDPTPLWMTDSTSPNYASYVAQYYRDDPYISAPMYPDVTYFPWTRYNDVTFYKTPAADGASGTYLFSFEENEGYDTDHDFSSDCAELKRLVDPVSDPLLFSDPNRRQALWFDGVKSAAISRGGTFRRATSSAYDLFRQFTVECWIKPEGGQTNAVVVERVSNYGASTKTYDKEYVRANFRIGFDENGLLYGEYEGSTTNSGSLRVTAAVSAVKGDKWAHVALVFGSTLKLYVNGTIVDTVSSGTAIGMIPANGIYIGDQEAGSQDWSGVGTSVTEFGYLALPCATVIGASAQNGDALDAETAEWSGFAKFYKGYVDEVRIWDGARTSVEIADAYQTRYSFDDVKTLRNTAKSAWTNGARRNGTGANAMPAELLQHYNFVTLPGATDSANVIVKPVGFNAAVLGNASRPDGKPLDDKLVCGWWNSSKVHSEIYRDYHVVPWIPNSVAHLPSVDGFVADSMYWSEGFAGAVSASEADGKESYEFSNAANPYPYYNFGLDKIVRELRLAAIATNSDHAVLCEYELRSGFVGTSDLLPLGNAFAKRDVDFWDGVEEGAMDAWTETAANAEQANSDEVDSDLDGIPDWAEALANARATEKGITDAYAYHDLVSAGLLPDGNLNAAYVSKNDSNVNVLPDWWERKFGGGFENALVDDDHDGLSACAEYLVSLFTNLKNDFAPNGLIPDPTHANTYADDNQLVTDYFLPVGKLYLGEMFADHDFMEDDWEDKYSVDFISRQVYDALADYDDDGWSNFAECRAATRPDLTSLLSVDNTEVPEYPIPSVKAVISYNGNKDISSFVVFAWKSGTETSSKPDAKWAIGSGASGVSSRDKVLGSNPGTKMTYHLGPGTVSPGSIAIDFKDPNFGVARYDGDTYISRGNADLFDADWETVVYDRNIDHYIGDLVVLKWGEEYVIGSVNYITGELTVDFAQLPEEHVATTWLTYKEGNWTWWFHRITHVPTSYARIVWTTKALTQGTTAYYLADADEGHLREGKNTFAVFDDVDGDGEWDAGEPYGVAADVDVGWNAAAFSVELTDVSPTSWRVNLADVLDSSLSAAVLAKLTDRYVDDVLSSYVVPGATGFSASSGRVRVRVVRTSISSGGETYKTFAVSGKTYLDICNDVVFDSEYDLAAAPMMSEASVYGSGMFDLDWGTLKAALCNSLSETQFVRYRIILGNGSVTYSNDSGNNNALVCGFENVFEATRTKAVPVSVDSADGGLVYSGRPTFRWTHKNSIGKNYPAFRLCVWGASNALVFDSGVQRSPARDSSGVYSWAAPLYAGMRTAQNKTFDPKQSYTWGVVMMDAKFSDDTAATVKTGCSLQSFRLDTSGLGGGISGYGSVMARVKYFGPAAVAINANAGLVRVQAFSTPDFSGAPDGEAFVCVTNDDRFASAFAATTNSLANPREMEVNAVIRGLAPGDYYVRAFIDTDGDSERDEWESWGYANGVGVDTSSIYTPAMVTVTATTSMPTCDVFVEDTDVDNDGLPDAWEWTSKNGLDAKVAPTGDTIFIKVNPNLGTTVSSSISNLYSTVNVLGKAMPVTAMFNSIFDFGDASLAAAFGAAMAGEEMPEESVAVSVKSFSLDEGLVLDVSADVGAADSAYVVVAKEATVGVYLEVASSVDFSDAQSVFVKDVVIRANGTTDANVTAAEVKAALDANGISSSAFIKVKISSK